MAKRKKKAASPEGLRGIKIPAKYKRALQKATRAPVGGRVWKPTEEGDAVAGTILSASWREGRNKAYCTLMLDSGTETVLVRPGAVLSGQLRESNVRIGAEVVMVYRGTVPSAFAGRPANLIVLEQVKAGNGALIFEGEDNPAPARKAPRKASKRKIKKTAKRKRKK